MNSRHHGVDRTYLKIPCLVALAALVGAPRASAQGWQGFVTIGAGSQYNCRPSVVGPERREYHVEFSGAVLHTIGTPRLAAGAQGDFCTHNGYLGGRGGPIAEFKLLSRDRALRPFAKGGYFVADGGGQVMVGGGIDFFGANSAGLRVSVQDAFQRIHYPFFDCALYGGCLSGSQPARSFVGHELSFHAGITWR